MKKLSHEEIRDRKTALPGAPDERIPVYALLDSVRSLYNVGSVFRTSDGAGISKLILTGYTPHPPRKEIEKTALGSTASVPWEYVKNPLAALQTLRDSGTHICALEQTDKSTPYYHLPADSFPLCLVVGNEITGVSKDIIAKVDFAIHIPMYGMKQSLNVAVAYGIAVFEVGRIWMTRRQASGVPGQKSTS